MRKRFYFLRHGECQLNINPFFSGTDDSLSEKGMEQAKSAGLRFKGFPIEAIYTSKILRARQTAGEIEKIIGIKPEIKEFLKERKGSFSRGSLYSPLEAFEEFIPRLAEAKEFFEKVPYKHVAVVTHAVFLKSFAAYLMRGDSSNEESTRQVVDILSVDNAAISKLVFNEEKCAWHIEYWNDQNHLS